MRERERDALNQKAQERWEQNAAFWDERFGDEGNAFHRELAGPAAERLLALQPGEKVLELACGNGAFTRRMAQLGAKVLATDVSEAFLPLSALLAPAFAAGFVLDGLEEPTFDRPVEASRPFGWSNYREIPPVLATRLRIPGG